MQLKKINSQKMDYAIDVDVPDENIVKTYGRKTCLLKLWGNISYCI